MTQARFSVGQRFKGEEATGENVRNGPRPIRAFLRKETANARSEGRRLNSGKSPRGRGAPTLP
jgi:hypothetical protein